MIIKIYFYQYEIMYSLNRVNNKVYIFKYGKNFHK